MNRNKVLSTLGLALRAKELVIGTKLILSEIPNHQFRYIFLASDASQKTIERFEKKQQAYDFELNQLFTTDELSHAIGKQNRKAIMVIDKGFIDLIKRHINS